MRNEHWSDIEAGESVKSEELAALRAIVEGTAQATGEDFFRLLVKNLSVATGVPHAFVAEFSDVQTRVRTRAFWYRDRFLETQEWDLPGTPCEQVLSHGLCHFPQGVQSQFPKEQGIESYLGVPLLDSSGATIGHLAIFDDSPMPAEPRLSFLFHIFAARAAAELERLNSAQRLLESEKRYRDLFDEAPIAYVLEDMDSRFVSANRTATRILGISPEEVPGTVGMSFVPDTQEAQRRVKSAFESIGRGDDAGGVILELRRRDNGQPIWIQWWSRPDVGGQLTRTMFIDITEQVLLEQEQARLRAQNLYLREEIKSVHNFDEIVGKSNSLLTVLDNVRRVAMTDASVLIRGETGTGKELIARAIHSASKRRDKPLIKINCAALPTGLVESELFGHEKGAFTGAIAKRLGRFELADGGTIFLDEIGEIPLEIQAKLLRVLQEREFDRIGSKSTTRVDVRVIAATNRDLQKGVADKSFREDLYYRLNVFPVFLPPLRERREDIPLLTRFLLDKFSAKIGKKIEGIDESSLERMMRYRWPGNIRELENVVERAIILTEGSILQIDPEMLPEIASTSDDSSIPNILPTSPLSKNASANQITESSSSPPTSMIDEHSLAHQDLASVEVAHIRKVLADCQWVIEGNRGAARVLGLHPNTLRSRMKRLNIVRPS